MRRIVFVSTILLSIIGVIIGLFIYGRIFFNPEMTAVYGIDSPLGCLVIDYFPKYFNDYLLSFVVISFSATLLITTIIRFLFKKTPTITNYKCDSFIRNDHFLQK